MENQFILDTNAYRQLVSNKFLCEIIATANEMRIREKKLSSRSLMSVVVSMELLRHFDGTDPHFIDCYKALALQFYHTQTKSIGDPENVIDFIPPINSILAKHFFNNNSEYYKHYLRTIEIVQNATLNLEPLDFKKDENDIKIIAAQLLHEKTEINQNFDFFLRSLNNGVLDWEFFKKDRKTKPQLLRDIQSGRMLDLMAEAQIVRVHAVMGLQYPQADLDIKRESFRQFYEPFLKLNQLLFEKMMYGATSLSDPTNPVWNTLHDSYLLAAACYLSNQEKDNDIKIVIVTDDKVFKQITGGTYLEGQVWSVREYLSFVY